MSESEDRERERLVWFGEAIFPGFILFQQNSGYPQPNEMSDCPQHGRSMTFMLLSLRTHRRHVCPILRRHVVSLESESIRSEVYFGSNPPLSTGSTDMPGRCRYGLRSAAAIEIYGCVKGDDPQILWSCLTQLPLVAGPGCCAPVGPLLIFRRNPVRLHFCTYMLRSTCL